MGGTAVPPLPSSTGQTQSPDGSGMVSCMLAQELLLIIPVRCDRKEYLRLVRKV